MKTEEGNELAETVLFLLNGGQVASKDADLSLRIPSVLSVFVCACVCVKSG